MKTIATLILSFLGLAGYGQAGRSTSEIFLGVKVTVHYITLHPGDSVRLPAGSYIRDLHYIEHGDYIVYSGGAPFLYPDDPSVSHVVHRSEGGALIDGNWVERQFDPAGAERFTDDVVVSRNASFHLYYFTLERNIRIQWKLAEEEQAGGSESR